MAFAGSKTNDIQGAFIQTRCRFHLSLTDWHKGDLQIPCEGEYFLSTSGVKFVPELQYDDDLQNLGTSSEDDGEGFQGHKGVHQRHDISDTEFGKEPIVGVELSRPSSRQRPPKMIALDSTAESITWMLSELDPKINIDKYQVTRPMTPDEWGCCKSVFSDFMLGWSQYQHKVWSAVLQGEIAKSIGISLNSQGWDWALKRRKHGDTFDHRPTAAQHLLHLSRRSQEQGGCQHLHKIINQLCDIKGSWLFSPKALRMTQNGSQTYFVSVLIFVFSILCSMSEWNTWNTFTHTVLIEISHDVLQYSVLYSEWEVENARSPPPIWA